MRTAARNHRGPYGVAITAVGETLLALSDVNETGRS
jgi:hypothetical protein